MKTLSEKKLATLRAFCARHPITKLEVFGSVAQGLAREDSDLDLLITCSSKMPVGLGYFGSMLDMKEELEKLLECEVDLIDRASVVNTPNPIKKNSILGCTRVVYEV